MSGDHPATTGVSILMPAFNLASSIGTSIDRVAAATAAMSAVEIVVCDDGSTDGTRSAAEAAAERHDGVVVVGHDPNQGKGAALQTAFAASSGEVVVFLDADLDLPPEQVPAFVAELRASGLDVLVGTKQEAMQPGTYPWYRRVLSKVFTGVIRLLFRLPVVETQTGLKAFRRSALEGVLPRLRVKRYTYDLELLVALHRRGFTMAETPVELSPGASGAGVSVRTLWEMGRDTLRIWARTLLRRI